MNDKELKILNDIRMLEDEIMDLEVELFTLAAKQELIDELDLLRFESLTEAMDYRRAENWAMHNA